MYGGLQSEGGGFLRIGAAGRVLVALAIGLGEAVGSMAADATAAGSTSLNAGDTLAVDDVGAGAALDARG